MKVSSERYREAACVCECVGRGLFLILCVGVCVWGGGGKTEVFGGYKK